MDFGRKAYINLMVSKDPAIRRLVNEGFDFVTNAFKPGSKPLAVRIKDVQTVASELERQGYATELGPAYNEAGDPIPGMQSVWRKRPPGAQKG